MTDYKIIFSPSSPQYVHKHRKITPLITRCYSNSSLSTVMLQGHGYCCDIRRLQWNSTVCLWLKVPGTLKENTGKMVEDRKKWFSLDNKTTTYRNSYEDADRLRKKLSSVTWKSIYCMIMSQCRWMSTPIRINHRGRRSDKLNHSLSMAHWRLRHDEELWVCPKKHDVLVTDPQLSLLSQCREMAAESTFCSNSCFASLHHWYSRDRRQSDWL